MDFSNRADYKKYCAKILTSSSAFPQSDGGHTPPSRCALIPMPDHRQEPAMTARADRKRDREPIQSYLMVRDTLEER